MKEIKDNLFQLVIENDPDGVHELLTRSPLNVDIRDADGFTPLMYAVNQGYGDMTRTLLFHYADANAVHSKSGWFPLLFAVDNGKAAALDYLLMVDDIDVNKGRISDAYTALHHAAIKGDLASVKKLVNRGANINIVTNRNFTPLMLAIIEGHIDVVMYLLSRPDINVNMKSYSGQTALMLAINNKQSDIINKLLAIEDINVNEKDNDGDTALHYAVLYNDANTAKKLIDAYANINEVNNNGDTPFALLADINGDTDALKAVLKEGMTSAANRYPKKMKHKTAGGKRRPHRQRKTRRHAKAH